MRNTDGVELTESSGTSAKVYPSDEEVLINALGFLQRMDDNLKATSFGLRYDLTDSAFSLVGLCIHHLLFQKRHEMFLFKMMIYENRISDNSIAAAILVFKTALRLEIYISRVEENSKLADVVGKFWAFQIDSSTILDLKMVELSYGNEIKEIYKNNFKPLIYKLIAELSASNEAYLSNYSIQRTLQRHGPFSITLKI